MPNDITHAFSHEPTDKRIDILRLVGISGSISQAARDAKVSYKAAWQAIDTLTNLAGVELVARAVGGTGGGGAKITAAGEKLLAIADLLAHSRKEVFASFASQELLLPRSIPMLSGISVRTSMRNQLPCQVQKLITRGQVVQVYLGLVGTGLYAPLTPLVSRITKASAELLSLKKGQQVLALCKATAVAVTKCQSNAGSTSNQSLTGQAIRVSRSEAGDEVSLQLDAGLQLVGFAAANSGLKTGSRILASINESAVVIALAA